MPKLKDHIIDPLNSDYTLCHWFKKYATRKQFITEPNENTCKNCLKEYNTRQRLEMFRLGKNLVDKLGAEGLIAKLDFILQSEDGEIETSYRVFTATKSYYVDFTNRKKAERFRKKIYHGPIEIRKDGEIISSY